MPAGRMLVADPIRRTVGEAIMLSSDINGIFFFFFFFYLNRLGKEFVIMLLLHI